jgi:polyferredoxin
MNPQSEEKQKKRPLNRKFLLRALVICLFLLLLPFAGMQAYKQSLYYFYKG